uniref:Uncharacterized protein n=1 Tax=Glossina austeni TaxID=7395 RepID=A0A1A9UYM5_GLOAU
MFEYIIFAKEEEEEEENYLPTKGSSNTQFGLHMFLSNNNDYNITTILTYLHMCSCIKLFSLNIYFKARKSLKGRLNSSFRPSQLHPQDIQVMIYHYFQGCCGTTYRNHTSRRFSENRKIFRPTNIK